MSEVIFYVCKNGADAIKHAKRKHKVIIDDLDFDGYDGTCAELHDPKTNVTFWMVWVRNYKDWKSMVHESAHLVFRILDQRGVKYDSDNDETWCFLQEFFVKEFWHVMC